jgi:hypothetical protein
VIRSAAFCIGVLSVFGGKAVKFRKRLTIRITDEDRKALERLAEARNISKSRAVRLSIHAVADVLAPQPASAAASPTPGEAPR